MALSRQVRPQDPTEMESSEGIILLECKATKFTRFLLTPIGVWQTIKDNSTTLELIISIILKLFCYSIILFSIIPASYHILIIENNLSSKIELCGPVGFFIMNMLKYTFIIYHSKDIKKCIELVESDWKNIDSNEEYVIMMKNLLIGRKLTILCAVFLYTGGMSYHTVMPFIMGSPGSKDNTDDYRPIVFPGYNIIFNPYVTPIYEIIFFAHCLAALIVYTITTASCNLAANFVTHACSQVQVIISQLNCLVDEGYNKNGRRLQNRVGEIVRRHARVLRFTVDIEKLLREICLVEVSISTIIICLLEYYCMTTWNESETIGIITYFLLLLSLSFNIFIFCYIGEMLKQQCSETGNSAYMIDWHRLPPNTAISLVLIITNAQVPRKITAGGLLDLSLNSFAKIMKNSLVYLNLLRTVEA